MGFPSNNTGVGCHFLLQGVFPTQGLSPPLWHRQVDSLPLSHLGSPSTLLVVGQSPGYVQRSVTTWTAAHQLSLFFTISQSLLRFMSIPSIESVTASNHLILCCPLLLLSSIFPSIRVFSNELAVCIRWPKYRNFSYSISPSNEYSGMISFRIDWLDLLAVQEILKSLLFGSGKQSCPS